MYKIKMSLVALALLSVLDVMASSNSQTPNLQKVYYDVSNARPLFEDFMKEHNRKYTDDADKELHYQAFSRSLRKINEMNEKSPHATFGINKFADYTDEERKSMRGFKKP